MSSRKREENVAEKNTAMKSGNQAEPRLQEQRNSGEYGSDEHLLSSFSSFLLLPQWTIQSAEAVNTSGLQHSLWMSFWNLVQNSPLVGPGCAWQHPVH
jgi:hypothetical protein